MLIEKTIKNLFKFLKPHTYRKLRKTLQKRPFHHNYLILMPVMLLLTLLLPMQCIEAVGYSYTRFVGPVAGPEHRIFVNHDSNGNNPYHRAVSAVNSASRLDYVAKPEYEFAYGVEDADAHILHNRNEVRDGDAVKGVYSLIEPDGALRVVKYTADETNGFQAEVIRNGISSLYDQLKHQNPKIIENNNKFYRNKPNRYSQSSSTVPAYYPQNSQQPQQINLHQRPYNLYNQYQQTPSTSVTSYNNNHYKNNNNKQQYNIDNIDATNNDSSDNDDGIDNGNDDYGEKPQYEVHEKPNYNEDHENQQEEEEEDDDNDEGSNSNSSGYKFNNGLDGTSKQADHDDDEDDDEYDDDSYDENYSEELENYDEAVQKHHNSNESDEYY